MFESLSSCICRHKKKLIFLGGVVGGVALLNTYLKKKLSEWETQRTAEICEQLKRSSHFDSTLNSCDSICLSFASRIRQIVSKTVDVDPVIEKLNSNPPDKIKLWEQLKVLVFTQAIGEMYSQCLLCLLLRVQMSILGGYIFTTHATTSTTSEMHQKYMSRIEDFMLNGVCKLLNQVRQAVIDNMKLVPLNRFLRLEDVSAILSSIQSSISHCTSSSFKDITSYLMPSTSSNNNEELLEHINQETRDVIESRDFALVLQTAIDCGMSSLMDNFSECFVVLSEDKDGFVNPHDFTAPLAKLIPILHNIFKQHEPTEPNSLVQSLLQLESLNNFAANIYEAFSHKPS